MRAKREKKKRNKHDLHSVNALSRSWSCLFAEADAPGWSPWRSTRLLATLLQNPFAAPERVHGRPVQSQIRASLICFPQQCSEPAKFSPLVRRHVGVGGPTPMMMMMMTMLSHMSATVKTCWYHTLCRHHHNKATITNSFTFWGLFRLPAMAWLPWED